MSSPGLTRRSTLPLLEGCPRQARARQVEGTRLYRQRRQALGESPVRLQRIRTHVLDIDTPEPLRIRQPLDAERRRRRQAVAADDRGGTEPVDAVDEIVSQEARGQGAA